MLGVSFLLICTMAIAMLLTWLPEMTWWCQFQRLLLLKGPSTPCCSNPHSCLPYHHVLKPHDVPKEHISILVKDFWFFLSSTPNGCSFRPGWISCFPQSAVPMTWLYRSQKRCLPGPERMLHLCQLIGGSLRSAGRWAKQISDLIQRAWERPLLQ